MKSDTLQTLALVAVLVCAGGAAWWLHGRSSLEVDAQSLSNLPMDLEGWKAREIPLEGTVERMLMADFNLQRAYAHPLGDVIWLYVGYYGTQRGGRPEHTPWVCYPSAGWKLSRLGEVTVDPARGLQVNEVIVEREGDRRLVHFWYQSHRRTGLLGGFDQALDRLAGRFLEGRADGALVRVSTPLRGNDVDAARMRLIAFARSVDPLIAAHWPNERMPESAAPTTQTAKAS